MPKPNQFSRMTRDIVWPAVSAGLMAGLAVGSAVVGWSTDITLAFGLAGITLAILSPRNY